jgi:hypoxanthine phosphoribosyltransferase
MMECPYCGSDLKWHDYYGKKQYADHYYIYPQSWIEKTGDIYKCNNEECESYEQDFYTDKQGDLHEGYPC